MHTPMPTEELAAQYEQGGMLETAGQSAQLILKLCKTTGCRQLAADTNEVVNSREELQLTLHGFWVECYREVSST